MIAKANPNLTPEQRASLLKQTGMNELVFDSVFNNAKKDAEKVTYTYHNIKKADGTDAVLAIGQDPKTGELIQKEYSGVNTGDKPVKTYDGLPYTESKDPQTGKVTLEPVPGVVGNSAFEREYNLYKTSLPKGETLLSPLDYQMVKEGKIVGSDKTGRYAYNPKTGKMDLQVTAPTSHGTTPTTNPSAKKKQDVGKVGTQLDAVSGADGYVSPENYKKARAVWIKEGYSTNEFDTQFKGFVNPKYAGSYSINLKNKGGGPTDNVN